MKDHKKKSKTIDLYTLFQGYDLSDVITNLENEVGDRPHATFGVEFYQEGNELMLHWWEPLTPRELEVAKEKRRSDREALRKRKERFEQEQVAEMIKIAEKYGYKVEPG
jgi:hypothetical protein